MKGDIQMPVPKFAPMPPIDLAGPQGGMLGVAFAAGFIVCGTVLGLAARWFWKMFGDRRIAQLEATREAWAPIRQRARDVGSEATPEDAMEVLRSLQLQAAAL